jgi:hypothetical protein
MSGALDRSALPKCSRRATRDKHMTCKVTKFALASALSLVCMNAAPALAASVTQPGSTVGLPAGAPFTGQPRWRERHYRDHNYAYERGRFGGCRNVTIERDDGTVRRVRRCD